MRGRGGGKESVREEREREGGGGVAGRQTHREGVSKRMQTACSLRLYL